jgi:hypothetical protein
LLAEFLDLDVPAPRVTGRATPAEIAAERVRRDLAERLECPSIAGRLRCPALARG